MAKTRQQRQEGQNCNRDIFVAAVLLDSIAHHRRHPRTSDFEAALAAVRTRPTGYQLGASIHTTLLQLQEKAAADKAERLKSLY